MVLRLAERLDVPLRERNALLVAAGYAPMYRERPLDDPALSAARRRCELILKSHEPYPALAVDRHWNLLAAQCHAAAPDGRGRSRTAARAGQRAAPEPASARAWRRRIVNLGQWRNHLFERLRQQIHATGDSVLAALLEELRAYPVPEGAGDTHLDGELLGVAMPFKFQHAMSACSTSSAPPPCSARRWT